MSLPTSKQQPPPPTHVGGAGPGDNDNDDGQTAGTATNLFNTAHPSAPDVFRGRDGAWYHNVEGSLDLGAYLAQFRENLDKRAETTGNPNIGAKTKKKKRQGREQGTLAVVKKIESQMKAAAELAVAVAQGQVIIPTSQISKVANTLALTRSELMKEYEDIHEQQEQVASEHRKLDEVDKELANKKARAGKVEDEMEQLAQLMVVPADE